MSWKNFARAAGRASLITLLIGCAESAKANPDNAAAAPAPDCRLTQIGELPVEFSKEGDFLVPVTINGVQTKMIFSTTPGLPFLFENFAGRMGLKVRHADYVSFYGNWQFSPTNHISRETGRTHLNNVVIGGIPYPAHDIVVIWNGTEDKEFKETYQSSLDGGAAGVLGPYYFKGLDVEFDLAENKIILFGQNHCAGQVQHWKGPLLSVPFDDGGVTDDYSDEEIKLPVSINGHAGQGLLKSSTRKSVMTWDVANYFGIQKDTPGVTKENKRYYGDENIDIYSYIIPRLVIGDETLVNVPVEIQDIYKRTIFTFTLGWDFFSENRIFIAYKERVIYFTPYSLGAGSPAGN